MLAEAPNRTVALRALLGAGGYGKTTLAALCRRRYYLSSPTASWWTSARTNDVTGGQYDEKLKPDGKSRITDVVTASEHLGGLLRV